MIVLVFCKIGIGEKFWILTAAEGLGLVLFEDVRGFDFIGNDGMGLGLRLGRDFCLGAILR